MPKLNIDILNIFLILLSGVFAFILPFQTFLFIYAFLGPLHYLTEINWLQQRDYFLNHKNQAFYLFIPIILITAYVDINVSKGLDLGANDFIRKPIDYDELMARIKAFLRLKDSVKSPL